ncbi:hypothetical protein LAJ57_13875, partial [Streptococcus pneumoniae]|uniref:hypothetical protein n=1 Tax=Streptococcus pneumoniae TaxID=1313 RepID=UPI001CBDECE0
QISRQTNAALQSEEDHAVERSANRKAQENRRHNMSDTKAQEKSVNRTTQENRRHNMSEDAKAQEKSVKQDHPRE